MEGTVAGLAEARRVPRADGAGANKAGRRRSAECRVHRILVLDDDRGTGRRCARWLARQGHEVLMATSGREAFNIIETQKPEAMVLDLLSPRSNGKPEMEARAVFVYMLAQGRGIPVVVCTNAPEHLEALRSWEADAHVAVRSMSGLRAAFTRIFGRHTDAEAGAVA
jgi:CheY-like chemotaxis protein